MSIPLQKNPKNTKTLRQELRASATPAEKLLWQYIKEKQILFLKNDLKGLRKQENKYFKIIQFYCDKLVELGAMKKIANHYTSEGLYTKRLKKGKKETKKVVQKKAKVAQTTPKVKKTGTTSTRATRKKSKVNA